MKRELRKSDRLLHATFLEKRFSKKRNGRRLNHVWLDLFGQHADYLNVIQSPYETRARNARTLLDGLTVGKSASSVKPLIHQQKKFNKNLFEQKIAHFEGKGLLILPSSLSTSERSLQHDSESIRSAIYVGLAWVLRGSCVGLA
ncbi:hypothetical protein [Paraburkholderia dioscoreae]|nr:hypothetical protein [Paraburkholderia dioscoreae]